MAVVSEDNLTASPRCGIRRDVRHCCRTTAKEHKLHGNDGEMSYSPLRSCSALESRHLYPDSFSAIVWECGAVEAAILPPYALLS